MIAVEIVRRRAPRPRARTGDSLLQRREEALERVGPHDEAGRHGDAGALQLAEAAAFAADLRPVGEPDVVEPGDDARRAARSSATRGS